jgi:catechol 2,3-dioxygenase-like lactoylglutathione lyase family enzyme
MKEDWKTHHVGVIVSDMDRAVEYYKSLGIVTVGRDLGVMQSRTGAKVKARWAQMGPLLLELFQPIEGEDIQLEFLREHGEGIAHIGFTVADIDAEVDNLLSNGAKLLFRLDHPTGTRIVYFDTREVGGFIIELVQPADKDFLAEFLKPEE